MGENEQGHGRTAAQAGWHASRYNLMARVSGSKNVAIANLFRGTCAEYTPIELYLLSVLDEIDEHHPIIDRLSRRGVVVNFDELAAVETLGRAACAAPGIVSLTICPTMGCNFDCPYCFENHRAGKMSREVQDDVVALAERMLEASGVRRLAVTWFGGEPLLFPDVIESLSGRLMALAEERGCTYKAGIITNGYLLDQGVVDMLAKAKVDTAQVTIDGLGPTHDATRRLAGGGGSFERITSNLRGLKIPFRVTIRHNVHEGNRAEMDGLEALVKRMAEESGNRLDYYPAPVSGSEAADVRGEQVGLLCDSSANEVGVRQEARRFVRGRGSFCGACMLWSVGVDDKGNLYKCWESVDKLEDSFGHARDWDPKDPIAFASRADNLTKYLNLAAPLPDDECRACVWLPHCAGGCPNRRLAGSRPCVAYRDDPESFVLALHARIGEKGDDADAGEGADCGSRRSLLPDE